MGVPLLSAAVPHRCLCEHVYETIAYRGYEKGYEKGYETPLGQVTLEKGSRNKVGKAGAGKEGLFHTISWTGKNSLP